MAIADMAETASTVRAMNHVIDRGMAFYWGTSEWTAEQIRQAYEDLVRDIGITNKRASKARESLVSLSRLVGFLRVPNSGIEADDPAADGVDPADVGEVAAD